MADPIRLFAEFTDDQGYDWRVNIHDALHAAAATEFTLGADGFVLRYSGDNENRYQPVIGSELTFTLMEQTATETAFMDLLSTAAENRFSVSVMKNPDTFPTLWWGGVILPEQVTRPDGYFPIANTITAADDVGNLEAIDYNNDGAAYTGYDSILNHVATCLLKTRSTHLWGTDDFLLYVNDFDSVDYTGDNQMKDARVNHNAFYNIDENGVKQYFKTFEVLESIAMVFNSRIFQSEGKWWFLPVGAQLNSTELLVQGIQKDFTDLQEQDISADKPFATSFFTKTNGYEFSNLTPLKRVKRSRRYDGNSPLLVETLYEKTEFGTTLTGTEMDYLEDGQFLITGVFNYSYDGDGVTQDDERVGRVELQFELKCGDQYLMRNVNYIGTVQNFQLVSPTLLQYTGNTYDQASWETAAEKYYLVSPVFDTNAGGEFSIPINIVTPPLLANEVGIELTVTIRGIDYEGNLNNNLTNNAGSNYSINYLRAFVQGDDVYGDQTSFTAVNSDTCRFNIDQGVALIGDQDTVNSLGIIKVVTTGGLIPSSGWQSLNYTGTGIGINRLGVQEVLSGQRKALRIQRGEVFGRPIGMYQVIDDTDGTYALFEMTYTARPCMNEVEAFKLTRDTSTTTVTDGPVIDISRPISAGFQGATGGVYEAINKTLGLHVQNYGGRHTSRVLEIENRDAFVKYLGQVEWMIFNTWISINGNSTMYLPRVVNSEGRTIQFHSDGTIGANKYITLLPHPADTGVTIDGGTGHNFNRAYDGITILCHGGEWYIIQKKEK